MKTSLHLKSFLNSLKRNRLYTAINVFGFAVSLAFVIFLGLYVQKEYSVDSFHENKDRIYRLEYPTGVSFAFPVADMIKTRYPEVQSVAKIFGNVMILPDRIGGNGGFLGHLMATDSAFFSTFSFPFVEGSPRTAMRTQQEVVLTQTYARRLYGAEAALGETFRLFGIDYIVSGVVADFGNTHFKNPEVFVPYSTLADQWGEYVTTMQSGGMWSMYVLTVPGANLSAKVPDMAHYLGQVYGVENPDKSFLSDLRLTPLKDIYYAIDPPLYQSTNSATFLAVLIITTLAILIFAIINYINLSVAQLGGRAMESAMRRLLGESRGGVFMRCMTESILLCVVSLGFGILLVTVLQPWLQGVLNTNVSLGSSLSWGNVVVIIGGIFVLGAISGMIPALVIAGFKPIEVVRGTLRRRTKEIYSKVLIVFQYCITIILIGCTITILLQLHYMKSGELGFNKEHVITCFNLRKAHEQASFRDQLLAIPGVNQVSFARCYPMTEEMETWKIKTLEGESLEFDYYQGDSAYLSVLGLEVLHTTGIDDQTRAYWLNETAWKSLGLADDATEYQYKDGINVTIRIKGMVRDFHSRDFTQPITGSIIAPLGNREAWDILIKVSSADAFSTMDRVRKLYDKVEGDNNFEGKFLDQHIDQLYAKLNQMSEMVSVLSLLAIVISSLGLFAMTIYYTRQRAQEVAVRKAFGATNREVLLMLMVSFLKLVGIAFVVAVPITWDLMREWLSEYAYRIDLSWYIFIAAGIISMLIAALTVLWCSLRAARLPLIEVLKK